MRLTTPYPPATKKIPTPHQSKPEYRNNAVIDKKILKAVRIEPCKKIRLQETARHADVASIQGSMKLSVPTRIENIAMRGV